MEVMKQKFIEKALSVYEDVQKLKKEHSEVEIGKVTIGQVLSGMKGIPALLTCTSKLDPVEGIRFRGYSIKELQRLLPKAEGGTEPLPEGLLYLMLLDELPTQKNVEEVSVELTRRVYVPHHVYRVIDSLPKESRPMTKFSCAILAWATESKFQKAHRAGVPKSDYWDTTYEDVLNFVAGLPRIAAYIYRKDFKNGDHIAPDPRLDWAANFAHMMGFDSEEVRRLFRLYMFLHADHEGGNVSAHATHLVGSALSNCYYSYAAGMLGLAGPLHGNANQKAFMWITDMLKELGTDSPTKEMLEDYVNKTLKSGQVVPGYGHAVLRRTDPRFMAQKDFADKYIYDDKIIKVVNDLYEVVPPILGSIGKVKNPWPNVDAYSGALLHHYGIKEYSFYTVMFGVSRALGVLASFVWDRVLELPIERPSSFTIDWFNEKAEEN